MVFHFFQPWATIQPLVFSFAHPWLLSCPWFSLRPTLGCYSALGFPLFPSLATIQPLVFHFFPPLAVIPPWACIRQVRVPTTPYSNACIFISKLKFWRTNCSLFFSVQFKVSKLSCSETSKLGLPSILFTIHIHTLPKNQHHFRICKGSMMSLCVKTEPKMLVF